MLRSQQAQVELQNSINITYGILGNILQILDAERECSSEASNTMLGNSIKKSENDIANIVKRPHNFIRKTKSYLKKKNPNDFEKLHPDFLEEGKEKGLLGM